MLIAAFAYRYEPDWMVDQLRENLSWVDGFAEWDTRDHPAVWVPAKERTAHLRAKAKRMGATWFLQVAPDERFEPAAENVIRQAVEDYPTHRFSFNLREMWTPTAYRTDGIWGTKKRKRLYRLAGHRDAPQTHLGLNLYHLKMIEPDNREERRRVFNRYNKWDNRNLGFDYLTDETGLTLEEIPEHRMYRPAYEPYRFSVPC